MISKNTVCNNWIKVVKILWICNAADKSKVNGIKLQTNSNIPQEREENIWWRLRAQLWTMRRNGRNYWTILKEMKKREEVKNQTDDWWYTLPRNQLIFLICFLKISKFILWIIKVDLLPTLWEAILTISLALIRRPPLLSFYLRLSLVLLLVPFSCMSKVHTDFCQFSEYGFDFFIFMKLTRLFQVK